jgi:predicted nucleic acid-binding protein
VSGFLLDTNVPSDLIRAQPDPRVSEWVFAQDPVALHLSVITVGELRKGLRGLPLGKRRTQLEDWLDHDLLPSFAGRLLPVTQLIADRWATFSADRKQLGRPLSMADGVIAATAAEDGLTVATHNVPDFDALGRLTVYNPW